MIGRLWDRALTDSLVLRRRENLNFVMGEIEQAVAGRPDAGDLVDEMLSLGSVIGLDDGTVAMRDARPDGRRHEVRDLLRAPAAPALDRDQRAAADHRRPRPDRAGRLGWACSTCGRSSTTSWRSTRTRARPRSSWPRPASAPDECASATAWSRPPRATTTRPVSPSASPCWTWSRTDRVEFGTGESSSEAELGGFGVDRETKRQAWLEGLEVAIRCMTETPFGGVDGRFVTMPPRNVVPKPVQKPHPPLWVACSRRDTILLAAEKGIGALSFAFVEPEDARPGWTTTKPSCADRCVPGRACRSTPRWPASPR